MNRDFDVVIVGARCAGAATALLLARAGVRALVVDKGVYGTDTLSTHALMRGAVMQLQRWGVLSKIIKAQTPPVRLTTFGYRTQTVEVAIEPRDAVDALYAPRRTVLDRALVDAATLAGAHFSYRTQVSELTRDTQGRVDGLLMTTPRGTRRVRADLVIGADGLHSTIARRVAANTIVAGTHTAATLYSYWQDVGVAGYEWHYSDGASVGAIPTNDAATCVFISLPASQFARAIEHDATTAYERLLGAHFPRFAERLRAGRRIDPVRGFGGHPGYIRRAAGPGWALVGDAGYFKDPLTAHGITDALRDAELLARAVVQGTAAAVSEYDATRRELSQELFDVTDRIASFTWTDDELQRLHRLFSHEMSREQRMLASLEPLPPLSLWVNAPLVS
jgi:flavin-dependent dehydrogenase